MSQRIEPLDGLDDFPTPPWATRALIEHAIGPMGVERQTAWEPACNRGSMARPLAEYFGSVRATDIANYGYGQQLDFLAGEPMPGLADWIITNPPFRLAEAFILRALGQARVGVAMLCRTVLLESVSRYERLFLPLPPTVFAQFTERVPMFKGRLDRQGSTATSYAWFVWRLDQVAAAPRLTWIPPCRRSLEREGDYDLPDTISAPSLADLRLHAPPA